MKKSLLLTLEFPPEKGGTQKYYSDICQNLPKDKIFVLTSVLDCRGTKFCAPTLCDYKIYYKKLITNYIWPKWLPMIWHLYQIIKKEKIELIQVGQVLPCGIVALIFKKIFGIDYIVYAHGLDILIAQKSFRKKNLAIKILNNAKKVISNSEFVKSEVIKLGVDKDNIVVIYPTISRKSKVESRKSLDELFNKYNLKNKKVLLSVCRLVDRKGVDLVIKALNKIGVQIEDLVYVVVGDGPKKEELKKMVGENENIIFTGHVSDEELEAWYSLCDVFILTPKKSDFDVEGFGIVYLEANSFGKPVIGSNMTGIGEAVEDGVSGTLVEPSDIDQISEAIVKMFSDEDLRKKLGEDGKKRVDKIFGISSQIEKIREILR